MSEQDGRQVSTIQRPPTHDPDAWKAYWEVQGQPWRTEPEIDGARQQYLDERRSIAPHIEKGIYPFRGIKLNRADVEWLLATHENGRGPVDWNEESQRARTGLDLRGADLRQQNLQGLPLARLSGGLTGSKMLNQSSVEERNQAQLHLEGTNLAFAHLEGAYLAGVHLQEANLYRAHLEKADLYTAHIEGARLTEAHVEGASLRRAFCDAATTLYESILGNEECGVVFLSDIHWNDAHISLVNWAQVKVLGDEQEAKQPSTWFGHRKNTREQLEGYQRAVRANRQLASALHNEGVHEDGARFAYRAQLLQRKVFWYQRKFVQYLFSFFLDLLAGYGYKPGRSFAAYLLVITAFAAGYFLIGQHAGPALSPLGSFIFSMTAFHGRGFFPGGITLDDPLTVLAALEAFVGLLIEVTFIATLTQRLFGK